MYLLGVGDRESSLVETYGFFLSALHFSGSFPYSSIEPLGIYNPVFELD